MVRLILIGGIVAGLAGGVPQDSNPDSFTALLSTPSVQAAQESTENLAAWPEIEFPEASPNLSADTENEIAPAGEGRLISPKRTSSTPSFVVRNEETSGSAKVIRTEEPIPVSAQPAPEPQPAPAAAPPPAPVVEVAAVDEEAEAMDDLGEDGEEIGEDSCAEPVDEEGQVAEATEETAPAEPTTVSTSVNRKKKGYTIRAEGDDLVVYDAGGVEIYRKTRGSTAKAKPKPAPEPVVAPPMIEPIDQEIVDQTLTTPAEPTLPTPSIPLAPTGEMTFVEVKRGDNPYTISKRFPGISAKEICEANAIKNPSNIQVGTKLWIPTHTHNDSLCHTVQAGETLSDLLKLYEIDNMFEVCDVNGFPRTQNELEPGTQVVLPGARKKAAVVAKKKSKPLTFDISRLVGRSGWEWPVQGDIQVTSPYGLRIDPFSRSQKKSGVAAGGSKKRFHHGIDLRAPIGTPVVAARDGEVSKVSHSKYGHGNMIEIRHDDGWTTVYSHNSKILKKMGDSVKQGETVALSGNTGRSTAPHIHFEIRRPDQRSVDPRTFLAK